MKKSIYTLVITTPTTIIREFEKKETITDIISAIFGTEKSNNVTQWLNTLTSDSTYKDNEFYIHYINI